MTSGGKGALLALDAGNSRIGVGVFEGERLVFATRIPHREVPDPGKALAEAVAGHGPWGGAILASVVPSLDGRLVDACREITGAAPLVVDATRDLGLTVATRHPEQVGADRLVNSAAAFRMFGGPLVVVDAGTAVTTCAVTADGRYLGGAIAPGPGVALEALAARTEKLPAVSPEGPDSPDGPIGDDTESAMRAGLVYGFAGLVDRLASEAARALGGAAGTAPVYLTGGFAPLLRPHLTVPHTWVEDLTLTGLRLLYARWTG
jgi:type III pantothenate kinase